MNKLIGTLVVCGFAAIWALYGASGLHGPAWLAPIAIAPSLLISLFALLRSSTPQTMTPTARRAFLIVVALEGLAIFVLVNIATNLGRPDLSMPAIGLVVGLHFLPLARIVRYSTYLVTGVVLCALAIGSAFIAEPARAVILGFGAAATLWLTMLSANLEKPDLARA